MSEGLLFNFLFQPSKVFQSLSQVRSPVTSRILRCSILILLLPPLFSWLGASRLGWRLGGSEPVFFDTTGGIVFSLFYFIIIGVGFVGTVFISRWMASTYGARTSRSLHFAFFSVVCAPLVAASAAHLYPDVFFNVLILLPALIWSITLLYKGLPVVLDIPPERGMLMASALVGWLLVAAVSLLGISVVLWMKGAGSALGV